MHHPHPTIRNAVKVAESSGAHTRPRTSRQGRRSGQQPQRSTAIDFVARNEFELHDQGGRDGRPWDKTTGLSYRTAAAASSTTERAVLEEHGLAAVRDRVYKRDLHIEITSSAT